MSNCPLRAFTDIIAVLHHRTVGGHASVIKGLVDALFELGNRYACHVHIGGVHAGGGGRVCDDDVDVDACTR